MPASRVKEERMWRLADELARSGEYSGWIAIEHELTTCGYSRARRLLDDERSRKRLDRMCSEAQFEEN